LLTRTIHSEMVSVTIRVQNNSCNINTGTSALLLWIFSSQECHKIVLKQFFIFYSIVVTYSMLLIY